MKRELKLILALGTIAAISGCGCVGGNCGTQGGRIASVEVVQEVHEDKVPGTVTEAWVEPMYEHVKVPGQLDPTSTYYRAPHKTMVEIRPGRFQRVEYPSPNESVKK